MGLTDEERAALQAQLEADDQERAAAETAADVAEVVAEDVAEETAVETAAPVAAAVAEDVAEETAEPETVAPPPEPTISDRVALINAESQARQDEIRAQADADIARIQAATESTAELSAETEDTSEPPPRDEPPPPRGKRDRFVGWFYK